MNKNITALISFVAGAVIGVAASYKMAEKKYNDIANDEITSVKEMFNDRLNAESNKEKEVCKYELQSATLAPDTDDQDSKPVVAEERKTTMNPSLAEYKSTITKVAYDQMWKGDTKEETEVVKEVEKEDEDERIYVISPDEFNTLEDYGSETFYYTADNYVINSDMEELSDSQIALSIGQDPVGHFGEYDDDSVYVRNETRKIDYEILLSEKNIFEIQQEG